MLSTFNNRIYATYNYTEETLRSLANQQTRITYIKVIRSMPYIPHYLSYATYTDPTAFMLSTQNYAIYTEPTETLQPKGS